MELASTTVAQIRIGNIRSEPTRGESKYRMDGNATRIGNGSGARVHSLEAVSRRDVRGEELTPEHRQGDGAGGRSTATAIAALCSSSSNQRHTAPALPCMLDRIPFPFQTRPGPTCPAPASSHHNRCVTNISANPRAHARATAQPTSVSVSTLLFLFLSPAPPGCCGWSHASPHGVGQKRQRTGHRQ
jgi:hypothetical protein